MIREKIFTIAADQLRGMIEAYDQAHDLSKIPPDEDLVITIRISSEELRQAKGAQA